MSAAQLPVYEQGFADSVCWLWLSLPMLRSPVAQTSSLLIRGPEHSTVLHRLFHLPSIAVSSLAAVLLKTLLVWRLLSVLSLWRSLIQFTLSAVCAVLLYYFSCWQSCWRPEGWFGAGMEAVGWYVTWLAFQSEVRLRGRLDLQDL